MCHPSNRQPLFPLSMREKSTLSLMVRFIDMIVVNSLSLSLSLSLPSSSSLLLCFLSLSVSIHPSLSLILVSCLLQTFLHEFSLLPWESFGLFNPQLIWLPACSCLNLSSPQQFWQFWQHILRHRSLLKLWLCGFSGIWWWRRFPKSCLCGYFSCTICRWQVNLRQLLMHFPSGTNSFVNSLRAVCPDWNVLV